MKLSSQKIIKAPISDVFASILDFESFEGMLSGRGAKIARTGSVAPPQPGATWRVNFKWHERAYDVDAELVSVDQGHGYAIESQGNGITCMAVVDLQEASATETKLFVSFDFAAASFGSKLLLQTLRLTGSSLNRSLDKRVDSFASKLEKHR